MRTVLALILLAPACFAKPYNSSDPGYDYAVLIAEAIQGRWLSEENTWDDPDPTMMLSFPASLDGMADMLIDIALEEAIDSGYLTPLAPWQIIDDLTVRFYRYEREYEEGTLTVAFSGFYEIASIKFTDE